MKVSKLFEPHVASSRGGSDYSTGHVPFVANSGINNGVSDYVEPLAGDKVFDGPAINVSGLGYATVQLNKFLPKGNGGDSCTVLVPRENMTIEELLYYAALFNVLHSWRFSFGRKANKKRIGSLELAPSAPQSAINLNEYVSQTKNLVEESVSQSSIG